MSKITIDLEDLKSYIKSLPTDMEEWYNEEWALYAEGIHAYVKTVDLKFADTFKSFMREYGEDIEASRRAEQYEKCYLSDEDREVMRDAVVTAIGMAPIKNEDGSWRY
jgi:hypothetical protein